MYFSPEKLINQWESVSGKTATLSPFSLLSAMQTQYRAKNIGIFRRVLKFLIYLLTAVDILMFMYYSILRNAAKEVKKIRVKKSKGIKKGTKMPDFNSLLTTAGNELDAHFEETPFLIRLFPSLILGTLIFFIIW